MVISKPRGVKSTFNTSNATSQKPGLFFMVRKESLLSLQATEKRTCCEAKAGFWLSKDRSVLTNCGYSAWKPRNGYGGIKERQTAEA